MRHLVFAALLSLPASALADKGPTDVKKMASDDCARARKLGKTCVLTIENEQVDGRTPTAGDGPIVAPDFGKAGSLIRIRRDFIAEILKTAEDL
jgi:hypothetical protein